MANIIMAKAYHLVRRDTLEGWETKNPELRAGEICLVTDATDISKMLKICREDNTLWVDLEYFGAVSAEQLKEYTDSAINEKLGEIETVLATLVEPEEG